MKKTAVRVRVRYAETDRMGYLHHAQYLVYFELARLELLRQQGLSYREMEDDGYVLVVVEASCHYLAPAGYDDSLVVEVTLEKATCVRLWHSYRVIREPQGTLLARGKTVLGCVGPTGKPRALPKEVLEKLV